MIILFVQETYEIGVSIWMRDETECWRTRSELG